MVEAEKAEVIRELKAGRDALRDAVAGVDDAMAASKPSQGSWSILDCVEHVVVTECYLLTRLQTAKAVDQPFEKWRREAKIAARAADRSRPIAAPEQAHPRGRYGTVAAAMAAFDETRAEVVRWIKECEDDLRCMMTDHVLIEGPVTCVETLVMIAAHPGRHAKQIEEIRLQFAAEST